MPIELDMSHSSGARIRVIGVGGAGGNAVRTMIARGLEYVDFIAANTDNQALLKNPAQVKINLGSSITRGLGAGANPDVGRAAVEESIGEVREALAGSDMVFVTAGMGGGTGTGAAPVIAREARDLGALVVAIVTKPFSYENKYRMAVAEDGIRALREHVDALIVIQNDRILELADENTPFQKSLELVDEVLYNATKGIADIITREGLLNVDFADVVTVMKNQGDALIGIGYGSGPNRALEAAQNALNSPILEDMHIHGAKGILVNISGSSSLTMHEVRIAMSCIQKAAGEEANLIHGIVDLDELDDQISVTLVATGFDRSGGQNDSLKDLRPPITINIAKPADGVRDTEAPVITAEHRTSQAPGNHSPDRHSLLKPPQKVDQTDIEVPAVWRDSTSESSSLPVSRQQPVLRTTTQPIPIKESGGLSKNAAAELPSQSLKPVKHPTPDADIDGGQPEAFPRPRARQGSAGSGSNQPSFLRKIMD